MIHPIQITMIGWLDIKKESEKVNKCIIVAIVGNVADIILLLMADICVDIVIHSLKDWPILNMKDKPVQEPRTRHDPNPDGPRKALFSQSVPRTVPRL
jgi:hypothetical protein